MLPWWDRSLVDQFSEATSNRFWCHLPLKWRSTLEAVLLHSSLMNTTSGWSKSEMKSTHFPVSRSFKIYRQLRSIGILRIHVKQVKEAWVKRVYWSTFSWLNFNENCLAQYKFCSPHTKHLPRKVGLVGTFILGSNFWVWGLSLSWGEQEYSLVISLFGHKRPKRDWLNDFIFFMVVEVNYHGRLREESKEPTRYASHTN